jgi:predicted Zn-dependent protease
MRTETAGPRNRCSGIPILPPASLLGKILLRQNSLKAAVVALERAIALRPDHVPSHMTLANAYRKFGRPTDASREFQAIRKLNERKLQPQPSLRYHRGTVP